MYLFLYSIEKETVYVFLDTTEEITEFELRKVVPSVPGSERTDDEV